MPMITSQWIKLVHIPINLSENKINKLDIIYNSHYLKLYINSTPPSFFIFSHNTSPTLSNLSTASSSIIYVPSIDNTLPFKYT